MDNGIHQEGSLTALFKSICPLVKRLDEHRSRAKCLADLFDDEVAEWRQELLDKCQEAIFTDQDCVSTKPREILWRKGYYDTISMAKRFVHKHNKSYAALDGATIDGMDKLCAFIEEGMARLKRIIIRIEEDYNLDLKHLVDFSLFEDEEEQQAKKMMMMTENVPEEIPINKKITSLEIINFALESIHSLCVSLGDLHRYYLDFGLNRQFNAEITQRSTAIYYEEAFKLNPKNGMPQNQLGTLWIGRNHNLDSVYHYLYSLVCPKPFDLSEDNVVKIFQQSAVYLEHLIMDEDYQVTLRDFIARFMLIVDIFFFDKSVPTFNDLCRFLLCDLNCMLRQKREDGSSVLDQEILFKFTAILFFCMRKLKRINSPKVFQLNAFLAAICDQFVGSCNTNFEEFFASHAMENEDYQQRYQEMYSAYTQREQPKERTKIQKTISMERQGRLNGELNGHHGMSSTSTADGVSQDAYAAGGSSNDAKSADGRITHQRSDVSKRIVGNGAAVKKRAVKYRRRRRRSTYSSDSDLTSNFDSDSERSEDEEGEDDDSDYSHDEDEEENGFDSEEEFPANQLTKRNVHEKQISSEENNNDSDIVIEEEIVVRKTNGTEETEMKQKEIKEPDLFFISHSQEEDGKKSELERVEDEFEALEIGDQPEEGEERKDLRVRHKVPVAKYDPNLLLQFVATEPTIRALKVLFDWLTDNKEIIWECYQSNPEFVHKIMDLLNTVNLNIFTRRIFFERELLTTGGLREDIRCLFDARAKLPITEDLLLKHFGEFGRAQANLDWEISSQLRVTMMEENMLRIVKLKNFGFFICDRKKFGYAFRNCRFEQIDVDQVKKRKNGKKSDRREGRMRQDQQQQHHNRQNNGWGSGSGSGETRRERRRRQRRMNGGNGGGAGQQGNRHNGLSVGGGGGGGNRQQRRAARGAAREEGNGDSAMKGSGSSANRETEMRKKGELMGKLWLRNEVKNLESKARGPKGMGLLTPYVVVDTKALVQHLSIVKHFVRMEKFIVLIPSEVLTELDALKTVNDRARECIRWLDRMISNGSPFFRTQEVKEKLPIGDLVKPRYGARNEMSSFVEIAEFCHYLAKKHEIEGQPGDVLTLLTGEDLTQREVLAAECDYAGILRSIPVKFDRIDKFYGKLIKK